MSQMPPIARATPQDPRKGPSIIKMKSRPKKNLSFSNITLSQPVSQPVAATNGSSTMSQVKDIPQSTASFIPTARSTTPPPSSSTPPLTPQMSSSSPSSYQQQPPTFPTAAMTANIVTPPSPSIIQTPPLTQSSVSSNGCSPSLNESSEKKIDNRNRIPTAAPFTWEKYLEIHPAEVAPKEAFMQSQHQLVNLFMPGMKLEAKDPRNSASWCLATIIQIHGLRLRLRFDGGDSMNDFYELIDSDNIRSYGSCPGSILLPPMAYKGNLATYSKFVEKQLFKPDVVIAPSNYFAATPKKPKHNLFKTGMKLEAIDRKNPYLICPASVGEITGDEIKIVFDGWRGSFDYSCKYYSREIFPVNWCRDTNHSIAPPNGWDGMLEKKVSPPAKVFKSPTKEKILLKVDLVPVKQNKGSPKIIIRKSDSTSRPEMAPFKDLDTSTAAERSEASPQKKVVEVDSPKKNETTPVKKNETTPIKKNETTPVKKNGVNVAKRSDISPSKRNEITPLKKIETSISRRSEVSPEEDLISSTPRVDSSTPSKKVNGASTPKLIEIHSATRKSEKRKISESPQIDHSQNDSEDTICNGVQYQCARTVPYCEWQRSKESATVSDNNQPKRVKRDPSTYSVREVAELIRSEDMAKYSEIFENHEIDGKAFLLLTSEMMINHMGLKVGPVLKIIDLIEREKRQSKSQVSS